MGQDTKAKGPWRYFEIREPGNPGDGATVVKGAGATLARAVRAAKQELAGRGMLAPERLVIRECGRPVAVVRRGPDGKPEARIVKAKLPPAVAAMEDLCEVIVRAARSELSAIDAHNLHSYDDGSTADPRDLDAARLKARAERYTASRELARRIFDHLGRELPERDDVPAWEPFGVELPGFAVWLWPYSSYDTCEASNPRVFVTPRAGLVTIGGGR